MEKKVGEIEEVRLKVVSEGDDDKFVKSDSDFDSPQNSVEIVETDADAPKPDAGIEPSANAPKSNESMESNANAPKPNAKTPLNTPPSKYSKSAVRKTAAIIGIVALLVAASNGLKAFWNSAHSGQLMVLEGPAIISAWCGDPDAANGLLALPLMMSELSDNDSIKNIISPQRRAGVLASVDKFVAQTPVDKRTMTTLIDGIVEAGNGNPVKAAALLEEMKSDSPLVIGMHAAVLPMTGDYGGALKEAERGIQLTMAKKTHNYTYGAYSSLWFVKAQVLLAMGRAAEALKVLEMPGFPESLKETALKDDSVLQVKAASYLKLRQPDKAIVTACQMSRLNHMLLSTAYLMKGDFREATQHAYKSSLALSKVYSQTGRLDDALKYAKTADDAHFGVAAREQHVFVLNQMGRYREALAICADLSTLTNIDNLMESLHIMPELHADMAWAHAKLGHAKEALEHANWVLKVEPTCRQALEAAKAASQLTGDLDAYRNYDTRLRNLSSNLYDRPVLFSDKNK